MIDVSIDMVHNGVLLRLLDDVAQQRRSTKKPAIEPNHDGLPFDFPTSPVHLTPWS